MSEFKKILGNEKNIEHFKAAKETAKLSHAYIINGAKGSGKKTFVTSVAAGLLCEHEGIEPCGSCPSCKKILSENHPDFSFLVQEKASVVKVDEVREQLVETMSIRPYYGPYKIYVINNADLMNASSQNAILKTLEEPPEYGIIFLLTDKPEMLLPTIHSRCMQIDMSRLSDETIRSVLKKEAGADKEKTEEAVAYARGNLGKAIEIAKGGPAGVIKEKASNIMKILKDMDAFEINQTAKEFKELDKNEAIEALMIWFRDVLFVKANQNLEGICFPKEKTIIKNQAELLSFESINLILEQIENARMEILANVQAEALFEALFLKIRAELKK